MRRIAIVAAVVTVACALGPVSNGVAQGQPTATSLPARAPGLAPVVVKTTPAALATDVDPALDKITVTFDRPMKDKTWSWTGGGDTFPQGTSEPSYDASRTTCTLPGTLEPGKVYWVGINSPSFQNFKSAQGTPARRYVILFATRSADGKPTPLPADMLQEAKKINSLTPRMPSTAASQPRP